MATNHYRQGFVDGWVAAHKVLTPEEQHEPMAGGPGCLCTGLEDSPYWPVNPLCPIHGDVRDTSMYKQLECLLCGKPLDGNNILAHAHFHAACADAEAAAADTGFVIDSKDDYITAIEDAIEELDR